MCEFYTEKIIEQVKEKVIDLYWLSIIEGDNKTTINLNPANKTNNCYSVAKAFTVTALGLLYDEGKLHLDEKIVNIFKDELPINFDPNWNNVTIDMVIRHKFGLAKGFLDIDEEDVNKFDKIYGSRTDYLNNVLSIDLPNRVNEKFVYSDGAYYLLARIIYKKTGKDISEYLREKLFNKLNFEEYAWSKCPFGYSMGATGLYLRSIDIAKLAKVYLDNGKYENQLILSKEWCNIVINNYYEFYGKNGVYYKLGAYGQMIYFDKNKNLAIACTGYSTRNNLNQVLEILKNI